MDTARRETCCPVPLASRVVLGDVIQSVDGKPVTSTGDLLLILEEKKAGDVVRVGILRDGRRQEVQVRLDPAARGR